jgi:3-oxoacyl-[acyl-carrier-protein] synthase-3
MNTIDNVAIVGISSVVPEKKINNIDLGCIYGEKEVDKLIASIGVKTRHISAGKVTSADLCLKAAQNLMAELNWSLDTIGALIFVSQTAEYQLPATACILQSKLGLSNSTIAYDVNLGCSGYVYGLFLASTLTQSGIGRVLLLVGDTVSELIKPNDRSTELLFGDAGSATAIEKQQGKSITFNLGTDGSGSEHIIARKPQNTSKSIRGLQSAFLEMNGAEVFSFTLKRVPAIIKDTLDNLQLTIEDLDICVYHQANRFMIKHLAKKSKLSSTQVPLSVIEYGNTSCASIPLTLCSQAIPKKSKALLVGFGVGLSWGTAFCDLTQTVLLPVAKLDCNVESSN